MTKCSSHADAQEMLDKRRVDAMYQQACQEFEALLASIKQSLRHNEEGETFLMLQHACRQRQFSPSLFEIDLSPSLDVSHSTATIPDRDTFVKAKLKELGRTVPQDTFVFVFMSDGQDTENDVQSMETTITQCGLRLAGAGLRTLFKTVAIGKDSDVSTAMKVR